MNKKINLKYKVMVTLSTFMCVAALEPAYATYEIWNPSIIDIKENSVTGIGGGANDVISDGKKTSDNGYILAGYSYSADSGFTNNGDADGMIVKLDSSLNVEWSNFLGGANSDYLYDVIELKDGSFIAVGESNSTSGDINNNGGTDAIIAKYDSDGTKLWVKNWGGLGNDTLAAVIPTIDGGFIAGGSSDSTDVGFDNTGVQGTSDWVFIKYNKEGQKEWTTNWGGTNDDFLRDMIITTENKIVATGYNYNNGNEGAAVVQFNTRGKEEWLAVFNLGQPIETTSLTELENGDVVALGQIVNTDTKLFAARFDKKGDMVWSKSYGDKMTHDSIPVPAMATEDNGFITMATGEPAQMGVGNNGGKDIIMIKVDEAGNVEWSKNIGGNDEDIAEFIIPISNSTYEMLVGLESRSTDIGVTISGDYDVVLKQYALIVSEETLVSRAEETRVTEDIDNARKAVNKMPETQIKKDFQNRLNAISPDLDFPRKNVTAHLDIYIRCENMLSLSLDTNSVTFEEFSGVQDMERRNAVTLTVNSSLAYDLNAYMPVGITSADGQQTMMREVLEIKANAQPTYQKFPDIGTSENERIVLLSNQSKGNNITHGIDLKLAGGYAHEADIYKTTVKFEASQR